MHDGEVIYLMRDAGTWTVVAYKGNFENVGNCVIGYVQQPGTAIRNGSLINRIDMPRLWKWVNEQLTYGQQVIDDSNFYYSAAGNGYIYQGCFTRGNGSSTFRLPDDRGCFDRYLDSGRGYDGGRVHNYAGGYEADSIAQHNHSYRDWYYPGAAPDIYGAPYYELLPTGYNANRGPASSDNDNIYVLYKDKTTGDTGSTETTAKNNAKLPLIIY